MRPLRIGLLDDCVASAWDRDLHRFAQLAAALAEAGHEVVLFQARAKLPEYFCPSPAIELCELQGPALPVLASSTRRADIDPLIASYRAQSTARRFRLDCLVAPLRGGVSAGLLMARACGEAFGDTRVVLLADGTSLKQAELGADRGDLSLAVADGLERICVRLADHVIALRFDDAQAVGALTDSGRADPVTSLPGLVALAAPNASSEPISEIVYLAPFRRADGALTFIQAIEDLARQGLLKSQTITFLGPIDDSGGLNRNWAGLRALRWNFRFQLRDERCRKTAFDYVNRPGRLAVLFETDGSGLGRSPSPPRCLSYRLDAPSFDLADDLKKDLERAIVHGRLERPREAVDWTLLARFLEQINEAPPSRPATAVAREGASICIVHRNRSHLLSHLIESIPSEIDGQPVEIVIVDNASTPEHRAKLGALAANRIRQILLDAPLDQSRALMTGIGAARHRTILLCDDDNLFVQDGVARLCRALQRGAFDIVVSSLLVFDHAGDAPSAPAALTTFIGQAHTAGLFFNFFGDTAMCLDRDKFIAAGGFAAEAGACPCFDWMTLARMQAAGLTIGVLQEPAVLYRRDERANADNPQKLEQAGARALVFKAYRGRYVPALATRVAQNSVIDLF